MAVPYCHFVLKLFSYSLFSKVDSHCRTTKYGPLCLVILKKQNEH